MVKVISTWSQTLLGLATVKLDALLMWFNGYAPTRQQAPSATLNCTPTDDLQTCDTPNCCSRHGFLATAPEASGTSSTPTTPGSSSSLYDIIEEGMVQTAEEDVIEWEKSLQNKYGIANAMVKECSTARKLIPKGL